MLLKMRGLRLFDSRYKDRRYEATVFGKDFNFPSNLECFRAKKLALDLASCLPFHRRGQSRVQLRRGSLLEEGYSVERYDQTVLLCLGKKLGLLSVCLFVFELTSVSKRFG